MKRNIFKNWSLVRLIWLVIGLTGTITAVIQHNYWLLLPALYFVLGAIANVGCFAQSCAVNFKNRKEVETIESPCKDI